MVILGNYYSLAIIVLGNYYACIGNSRGEMNGHHVSFTSVVVGHLGWQQIRGCIVLTRVTCFLGLHSLPCFQAKPGLTFTQKKTFGKKCCCSKDCYSAMGLRSMEWTWNCMSYPSLYVLDITSYIIITIIITTIIIYI